MGRPWSIVRCSEDGMDEEEARWRPLLERTGCSQLRIPIRETHRCLLLEPNEKARVIADLDLPAEIRLLQTPDLTWDDVGGLLADQMIFVPVLGVAPVLVTIPGFESNTVAGGLDRLLRLGSSTGLAVALRTAGILAARRQLAILVSG